MIENLPEIVSLFIGIVSIIIAIISIYISKKAWYKSRAIYGIERTTLRQVRGRSDDYISAERINSINSKLVSGKYTIISITTREADGDFEIILGKIK